MYKIYTISEIVRFYQEHHIAYVPASQLSDVLIALDTFVCVSWLSNIQEFLIQELPKG